MPQLQFDAPAAAPARKASAGPTFNISLSAMMPVRRKVLADLTGQLALMLKAGTPLVNAIAALHKQTEDERLHAVLGSLETEIAGGSSLARALAGHPRVFGQFYVGAVESGEETGQLAEVFERLETFLRKQAELRGNLISALIYPSIIACIALTAVIFVLTFVLPRFIRIFEKAGVLLPLPTRILLGLSQFLVHHWYILPLGGLFIVSTAIFLVKNESARSIVDRLVIQLPLFGPLTVMIQTAQLLRTLGTLLGSGVPLVYSLEVTRRSCSNSRFRDFIVQVTRRVTQGERLTDSFEESDLMSPSIKTMVATAEQTGSLSPVMIAVADHLDQEIDRRVHQLSSVIEPMIIVAMGVVVGFIAISILLPLFRLSAAVGTAA